MALYSTAAVLILAATIAIFIYRSTRSAPARAPPECKPAKRYPHLDPIFGLDLLLITIVNMFRSNHIAAVAARHKKYGPTFSITNVGYRTIHTMDPENIRIVWEEKWQDWPVAPARQESMEPFCGLGFITTDGAEWKRFRNMLDPAFEDVNVSGLGELPEAFEQMLDRLPKDGESVDVVPYLEELFLDLTGTSLVGERFQRSENSGSRNKEIVSPQDFLRAFHAAGFWVAIRITFGWIGMNWPSSSFRDNCQMMHRFVDHYVTAALERASDATSPSNPNPRKVGSTGEQNPRSPLLDAATNANFVSSLVQQSSKTYEIRSQVLQIMLASQDVIATLLSNCIFLLSRHPNAWHKLRQEVLAHGSNERLSASTLAQLPYLQNIIKEALRLYPVFAQMGRTSSVPTTLPRGGGPDGTHPIFIPVGCRIIASFYALHRQPDVFGPDVEAFDPDRWNRIKPGKWEYLPFLDGPRSCPGRNLAVVQVGYCLARLAGRFGRMESRDGREWRGEWKLIVKNANGCRVALYEK